jgi:O-antigen/teichoic acid export membrane protein
MGESTRQVGTAVFWSVSARGGRFVLGLLSSVIVVRALGKDDYGVLSLARTLLAFVIVLASAGLGQSLLKFLPVLKVDGDRLVRLVFLIQAAVWAVLVVVGYQFSDRLEALFAMDGIGLIIVIAVALSLFELFFNLIGWVLSANYDTKLLSGASLLSHVIFIVLLLIMLNRGLGVTGVLVAAACGQLVASLVLAPKVVAVLSGPSAAGSGTGISQGRLLKFSLPFALIGLLVVIVWRQSETLFLAHYRSAAETGFFDLAYRVPQTILEFIPGAVWPIIMAGFSETYARNAENLRIAIEKYYKMLFLLSTPICLFGITMGGRMVHVLFGEEMAPASVPTQIFFAIFTVSFFATPLSMALYVVEKSHVNLLVYLFLAIVNVGLDFLFIPRFGVMGAIIPVGFVILISPFIYKMVIARFIDGIRIPYSFIGKCFLCSSPILLLLPFARFVGGVLELIVAFILAAGLVIITAKKLKLIGEEESVMLGSIPIPAARRLLKFLST